MDRIDCLVIGAGVVGLAVAYELAAAGREVIIVESATDIGSGTSSRNSEVIHAGIYYPRGSLKARFCVEGRQRLYRYCEERSIPYARCGKLLVATSKDQNGSLNEIAERARNNGVHDLRYISRNEARELEPELECTSALFSPSTGIIDSHALMHQLLGDAQSFGASIAYQSQVVAARAQGSDIAVDVETAGGDSITLLAGLVVNAAGLYATQLANRFEGIVQGAIPRAFYAKGNYYSLTGKSPFSRLIYPVPEPGGLGIHLTIDLAGQARFGPDVEWLDIENPAQIDFNVDPRRADMFYASIRRYWPALKDGVLQPSYAGVRPKVACSSDADFLIQGPAAHGLSGLVNLFGIESPGLTASLAIARHIRLLSIS
jgi:L-2-hydroxyglutarate oxidase LhgO